MAGKTLIGGSGWGGPDDEDALERTEVHPPGQFPEGQQPGQPPPIEVVLVRDIGGSDAPRSRDAMANWRAMEIWTHNRIYCLNGEMVCIEVINRDKGTPEPTHAMLGAKLQCGQRRYASSMHISYPFPIPGTTAAFTKQGAPSGRHRIAPTATTSKVERVVLRILLTTLPFNPETDYEDVTAAFLRPPGTGKPEK